MKPTSVGLVDMGLGNLRSVHNALTHVGARVVVGSSPHQLEQTERLVLPGVGSFSEGMARLHEGGWVEAISRHVSGGGYLLGICLGMQLLADSGTEHTETPGLGLVPGRVEPLAPASPSVRVPHIGWNDVTPVVEHPVLSASGSTPDCFYFVHSYAFVPIDRSDVLGLSDHGGAFVSAAGRGRVTGVQFHPEKSHRAGLELLRRFVTHVDSGSEC